MYKPELILGDCEVILSNTEQDSIDMIIESPPYYNARPEYSEWLDYNSYLLFMQRHLELCYRVLKPCGRIAINVPDGYGRNPWLSIYADILKLMQNANLTIRGNIIWYKGDYSNNKTSWGSWRSPSNPCLIDYHEMIIVAHKTVAMIEGYEPSIAKDDFMQWTKSVWQIKPENMQDHPAPFPIEIPRRLIELYTKPGAVILDSFVGSGTTCLAAMRLNRKSIGIEKNAAYLKVAESRINQEYVPMSIYDILEQQKESAK